MHEFNDHITPEGSGPGEIALRDHLAPKPRACPVCMDAPVPGFIGDQAFPAAADSPPSPPRRWTAIAARRPMRERTPIDRTNFRAALLSTWPWPAPTPATAAPARLDPRRAGHPDRLGGGDLAHHTLTPKEGQTHAHDPRNRRRP